MSRTAMRLSTFAALLTLFGACAPKAEQAKPTTPAATKPKPAPVAAAKPQREQPPPPGKPRPVSFPTVMRDKIDNGLELDTVGWHDLPMVYIQLVVQSGGETDPKNEPGLSQLVADMLKEGTRKHSSADLAEEVEFLGADMWTSADEENVYIGIRALRDQLDQALGIVADVAMNPAFRGSELKKLKKRELDRLALASKDPGWLAKRTFYAALYGDHPYAHFDTTPAVVKKVSRADMVRWHEKYFAPSNAFLTVVGDVNADTVKQAASKAFGKWRDHAVPAPVYPAPPKRTARQILLVDRPDSVQSIIYIGNLAIPRNSPQWIPMEVANQVLGGSAASRLFMDLRERRSLTYGAYSMVGERVKVGPFRASAAVRNQVTGEAMDAFFQQLDRITSQAVPKEELEHAESYLSDSFPLQIDTPGQIADLVGDLRIYGLPDGYWNTYRSKIRAVTSEQALEAAKKNIRPDKALIVVVGRAADILEPLRHYGPVEVLNADGKVTAKFQALEKGEATAAPASGAAKAAPAKAAPAKAASPAGAPPAK